MSIKQAIEALEELIEYAETAGFDWSLDNARAALAALRSMPQGEPVPAKNNDVDLLLRAVFELCEATEEAPQVEPRNEHQRGFDKGRRFEAKAIRRAVGNWFQATFCGQSFMGEPVLTKPEVPHCIDGACHLCATPHTEAVRQALTDPENQPNQFGVTFGMRGPKMYFAIGHQSFTLDYAPEEPGEFEFMRDMLTKAMSVFTPDVKPEAVRMSEAEIGNAIASHIIGESATYNQLQKFARAIELAVRSSAPTAGEMHEQKCPHCGAQAATLFSRALDGDELETVHCGCLHTYTTPHTAPAPAEPLFYYRPCMDGLYEGPHHARSVLGKMLREERPNDWHPLYAAHVPETNFGNTQHTEAVRMSDQEIDAITDQQWRDKSDTPIYAAHRAFARAVEQATAARLGVKLGDQT